MSKANEWQQKEWEGNANREGKSLVKGIYQLDILEKTFGNNAKVLDIGCGDGILMMRKNSYISKFYGYDKDPSGLKELQKIFKNVEIIDFNKPVIKEKVDVITMIDLIEHLTYQEIQDLLPFIDKALKKNGKILISTPDWKENIWTMSIFYENPEHTRPQTTRSIERTFSDYEIEKVQKITPYLNPFKILVNLLIYRKFPYSTVVWTLRRKNG